MSWWGEKTKGALPYDPAKGFGVIFCILAAETSDPYPGSSLGNCEQCKSAIWVNPQSQRLAAKQETPLMCQDCAEEYVINGAR